MDAVKVNAETITAEQLEKATPEQITALEKGEEIELTAGDAAAVPPPAEEKTTTPEPAGEGEQGKKEPDIESLKKQLREELQGEFTRKEKGYVYDLQTERAKRQQAEQRLQELAQKPPEPQPDNALPNLNDDDFVSVADMKRFIQAQIQEKEKQFQAQLEQRERERALYESTTRAREKHTDYDEVIQQGFSELAISNQQLLQEVLSDPNPGERAYQEGLKHPKFQEKANEQDKKKQELLNSIKNRPRTIAGGGSGGAGGKITLEQAANMSDAEWAALSPEMKHKLMSGV